MDNIDPEDLNLPSRRRRQATTGLEGVPVVGDVSLVSESAACHWRHFMLSMCAPDMSLHAFRIAITLLSNVLQLFATWGVCLAKQGDLSLSTVLWTSVFLR